MLVIVVLTRAQKHKKKKREIEIALIFGHISKLLKRHAGFSTGGLRILEFGSGSGYQIEYLSKLGNVIASDICINDGIIKCHKDDKFVQCKVSAMPFANSRFDIIFSNHVVEHINDLDKSFLELKRIGKKHCLYAFSIPTNIWLLLSLPGQYYLKFGGLLKKKSASNSKADYSEVGGNNKIISLRNGTEKKIRDRLLPHGHGAIQGFSTCYHSFKIKAWKELFERYDLTTQEIYPLLLYPPSSLPIIPMTHRLSRFGLSSSVLFLMQKKL